MSDLKILRQEDLRPLAAVAVGTRPSIVKMSPVIRELTRRGLPFFVIHTGQHYSYEMDRKFFEDLELTEPKFVLDKVRSHRLHGAQTAEMLMGVEQILLEEKPRLVFVCGDANFNLSAALAARKLRIDVAHTESGLRSDDWSMPEEHNRVMIDHISDYLFAPTEQCRANLVADNVKGKIVVAGNTVVDSVYENSEIAARKSNILAEWGLEAKSYFVCTSHREENVDIQERFESILLSLRQITETYGQPVIYPIHPRSQNRLERFGLDRLLREMPLVRVAPPQGYLDFLALLTHARLVLTDSGGIQEETCILQVPCVTLRDNTERPETVEIGSNLVAGVQPAGVMAATAQMLARPTNWPNPYGDGRASARIIDAVQHYWD